jgi:ABC-type sugar transport system permease subunit
MATTKARPHFSRKLLAIPYGLFLAIFVLIPLFIIVYYAFTNDAGKFTWEYVRVFFNESGKGFWGFFTSYNFKTILQSLENKDNYSVDLTGESTPKSNRYSEVEAIIKDIDMNNVTPIQAFQILNDLYEKLREENE